jgi:hypothetical protein
VDVDKLATRIRIADSGCWEWTGAIDRRWGYGSLDVPLDEPTPSGRRRKSWRAHRWSYTLLVEPIPEGLEIDHLCRNPACVNPDHLEPVTTAENLRRAVPFRRPDMFTHCPNGHPWTAETLRISVQGRRTCRICNREAVARSKARRIGRREQS